MYTDLEKTVAINNCYHFSLIQSAAVENISVTYLHSYHEADIALD